MENLLEDEMIVASGLKNGREREILLLAVALLFWTLICATKKTK
jgi:hypothetical protein